MATSSTPSSIPAVKAKLPGRRYDHLFFSSMAALLAMAVFAGFAKTYYLAGIFTAPLPSLIIHPTAQLFLCGSCCWSRKQPWYRQGGLMFTVVSVSQHSSGPA